jgi:glycosyl hydrolase family 42 (putative beta-galactosidase)
VDGYYTPGLAALLIGLAGLAGGEGGDRILFDFSRDVALGPIAARDAKVSRTSSGGGAVLRLATGHEQEWPGITLPAPAGGWDLTPYARVAVQVKNAGTSPVTLSCRVDNPGADGTRHCVTGSVLLNPGQSDTLRVLLKRESSDTLGGKLFGMRGYPVAPGGPATIDAAGINRVLLFVTRPTTDHLIDISEIRASGSYSPPTAWVSDADPFFPFIDTFGQYRHKDWPGKTHSPADLAARREQEAKELAAEPGPTDWDQFGGWAAGPHLKATGFFRAEKYQGKWWLIDPGGRLFFSQGLDCVGQLEETPTEERESWFQDFPGKEPEFRAFATRARVLKGHYAGRTPACFSFDGANLRRKYGAEWKHVYPEVIHRRLRSWGLNTIANWSDEATCRMRRTPYTDTIGSGGAKRIEGGEGYWGKFPDVFDPSFAAAVRRSVESRRGKSAGDPRCIGYFCDNEMSWGDEVAHAIAALKSPPDQAAKRAFVADLKARYGDITHLNRAWGTAHASWEALLASRDAPDRQKAERDLAAFSAKVAGRYFRTVREAIKAMAPHQLYLGCRFAWVNDGAAAAAAKYCDVVSYNLYRRSVAKFAFNGGADVPLLIGEFHFGALDRGLFHTGLVPVENQEERARAYREYVLGALRHPQFVGCHWFQYQDEPTTGRAFDEENYQIGFVDIADTPYPEMVAASRELAAGLYAARLKATSSGGR